MTQLGKAQMSPTGLTLWPLEGAMSIVWPGPGAGLYLGIWATEVGGSMVRIEHPTADGQYDTRKEALKAAQAFVASGD